MAIFDIPALGAAAALADAHLFPVTQGTNVPKKALVSAIKTYLGLDALVDKEILFGGPTGLLTQSTKLTWDDATKRLKLGDSNEYVYIESGTPSTGSSGLELRAADDALGGETGLLELDGGYGAGDGGYVILAGGDGRNDQAAGWAIIIGGVSTGAGNPNRGGSVKLQAGAGGNNTLYGNILLHTDTGGKIKNEGTIGEHVNETASRALNTTYANGISMRMVLATVRCAISVVAGVATAQGKSDAATPPVTICSGLVGVQAGLLNEDNTFQICFWVAPNMNYRIDSATTNGTVVLGSWFEQTF